MKYIYQLTDDEKRELIEKNEALQNMVYDDMLTQAEITYNLGVKNKKVCGAGVICDNLKVYYSF